MRQKKKFAQSLEVALSRKEWKKKVEFEWRFAPLTSPPNLARSRLLKQISAARYARIDIQILCEREKGQFSSARARICANSSLYTRCVYHRQNVENNRKLLITETVK